eukprot:m.42352 g.42352  ORF g.42352 m.42352 type:complete len:165 (-) comp12871_c0_seq8:390-884(-)
MSVGGSDVLIAVLQTQLPQLQKAVGEAATLTVFAPNDGWHSLADLLEAEDWTIAQRLQCCQNVFAALNNLIQCRFYLQAFDASTIYSNAEGHVMLAIGSLQCLASPSSPVSTILARAHTVKSAEVPPRVGWRQSCRSTSDIDYSNAVHTRVLRCIKLPSLLLLA